MAGDNDVVTKGVDISWTRTEKRGEFDEMEMAHVAFFKRN